MPASAEHLAPFPATDPPFPWAHVGAGSHFASRAAARTSHWQNSLDLLALAQSAHPLHASGRATVLGAPDGDVSLVAFIDYQSAASRALCAELDLLLQQDTRLRVLLRHLPQRTPMATEAAQLVLGVPNAAVAARLHRYLAAAPMLDTATLQGAEARFRLQPTPLGQANETLADTQALAAQLGIDRAPALVLGHRLWRGPVPLDVLEDAVRAARRPRPPGSGAWHRFWRSSGLG